MATATEEKFDGHEVTVHDNGDGTSTLSCQCGWPTTPILPILEQFVPAIIQRHHIMVEQGNA